MPYVNLYKMGLSFKKVFNPTLTADNINMLKIHSTSMYTFIKVSRFCACCMFHTVPAASRKAGQQTHTAINNEN